jgi:predicted DNA-binding transcriptional regulator AlpA
MTIQSSNERLIKILNAPPEQQEAIDRILDGKQETNTPQAAGPLLMGMSDAAKLLGVSRATLWRMLQAEKFQKVEILPGSFRLRRVDLENFVNGKVA